MGLSLFFLAGTYASVFGEMEGFLNNNPLLKAMFATNPDFGVTEQFISLLNAVMIMLGMVPILTTLQRVVTEERAGHAEHLLGRSVSRFEQLGAYALIALVMSVVYPLLIALGLRGWFAGLPANTGAFHLLISAYAYVPAVWVFIGLFLALAAFLPRQVPLEFCLPWLHLLFHLPEADREPAGLAAS